MSAVTVPVSLAFSDKLGFDAAEQTALDRCLKVLAAKTPRNIRRADYYDAKQNVEHLGIAVPPHLQDIETVLGWPEKSVSDLEERIDLEGFTLAGADIATFGLDTLVRDNRLVLEASQAHTSALKFCAAFISVAGQGDGITMRALSALSTAAMWDRDARRIAYGLTVVTVAGGTITKFVLHTPTQIITASRKPRSWDVLREPHSLGRTPLALLPFRPSLERWAGRSRISRPVMSITDRAIRTLLRGEVAAEFFSAPQRLLMGASKDAFKDEDGNDIPAWTSLIGRFNAIEKDEDGDTPTIWQAPQTSFQPHIDMVRAEAAMFSGETGVPPQSLGLIQDNPASDAAMKTAYMKLEKTAQRATVPFGFGWVDAAQMAVQMRDGKSEPIKELERLQAHFRPVSEPTLSAASDAMTKQITALPWIGETEVALERLGYSQPEIERLLSDKTRAESRGLLTQLASLPATTGGDQANTSDATALKAKFDALGVAIRAGVDPADAAARLGLDGIKFTGAVPVSLRLPEADTTVLEDK